MSGDYFYQYVVADKNSAFKYGHIIDNSLKDSHPILYYLILHTFSSMFVGEFSKWFGIVPNIIFLIMALILLYRIGRIIYKYKHSVFIPLLCWGISAICINNVVFIRMYMILTLFYLLVVYSFLKVLIKNKLGLYDYFCFILVLIGGMTTDYTFLPFAGMICIFSTIYLFLTKRKLELFKVLFAGICSLLILVFIYPIYFITLFNSLFFVPEGISAPLAERFSAQANNVNTFMEIYNDFAYGGHLCLILFVIFCGYLCVLFRSIYHISLNQSSEDILLVLKKKKIYNKDLKITKYMYFWICLLISAIISFVLIARSANWADIYGSRMIYAISPIITLIVSSLLDNLFVNCKRDKLWFVFFASIMFASSLYSLKKIGIIWNFTGQEQSVDYVNESNRDLLFVYDTSKWCDLYITNQMLSAYDEIYFIDVSTLNDCNIKGILSQLKSKDNLDICFQASDTRSVEEKINNVTIAFEKVQYKSIIYNPYWEPFTMNAFSINY